MTTPTLDVLAVTDLHYLRRTQHPPPESARLQPCLGPLLLRKALLRLKHEGITPGLILLLGDLVNNGTAPGAEEDLAAIADEAKASKIPFLAVPGNHDGDMERFARVFGCEPGLHEVSGYGFVVFHDRFGEGDVATRPDDMFSMLRRIADRHPALPLIALQHNPLYPTVPDTSYPYMPANTDAILASYVEAGVFLSVSGHYHAGQPLTSSGSTRYYTVPSGGEEPFRFGFLRLGGRDVEASEHTLRMSVPGLVDVHCHSEYSYCGTTVNAADNIRVARLLGVQKQFFTEHAFQLYFNREDAWSWRWQTDEAMVRNAWAAGRGRMPEFREFARRIRAPDVRVGLELDLRADGSLLLAEEDRSGWDLLVGAVHALPGFPKGSSDQALAEKLLLKDTERILSQPIQVLAHPFRFFRRGNLQRPVHLYKTVADLLAQAGVAAEVNFHTNQPDPRFVEECLSRGVRIALATDAHDLAEVGEFAPHLAVLRQAGVRDEDLPRVLFRPD